ncbi:MAG: DEAD/DEAH box helicase [Bryobacterales bacterium]|nr:DEAD/DEAH box helicase [Bryobacterales bacterium]
MNLPLGLPGFDEPSTSPGSSRSLAGRGAGLDGAITRFTAMQASGDPCIRAVHQQPAFEGSFAELPEQLPPVLSQALSQGGVSRLYSHQAEAFGHVQAGKHVVVVTPTASGKTLCYNLPVLQAMMADKGARALYLYPTKALAEDQLHELHGLVEACGSDLKVFTYDGDTPQDARRAIRERANVVLTNPDMLHTGILPHHTKWAKLFENLRYVVIDELHSYRGVYGSHLANVLRRLDRICRFYGSTPQFICCSATIANPEELASTLTGHEFEMVSENGAPRGEKYFVFYNPPVVNQQLGIRRGYLAESRRLALDLIERKLQTLVFANSRLATEVLTKYLKDAHDRGPIPNQAIRGYRGGYLPKERRAIEKALRDGEIRAVVATNALELGIDIGSLDAVLMAGYPGTIASTWQRAGRAGRRNTASIAVLVASSAPMDQFIIEHPEYFFGRSPERAAVNPNNLEILLSHLKCAVFELPIKHGERFGGQDASELCTFLKDFGFVHQSGESWHWIADTYPADTVSLRAITSDNFVVIDITGEAKVIAEVDFPSALTTLHEKAIYLHEARQYQVERFDYDGRKAYVRAVECDYFTDAIDYTQVRSIEEFDSKQQQLACSRHGEVRVNRQIVGFKKIKFYTMENIGAGHLSMPEQEIQTTAWWLNLGEEFLRQFEDLSPIQKQNGLAGLGNALRTVAAFLLMCDPRDLGLATSDEPLTDGMRIEPNLFLYDTYPGGIGLSEPLFRMSGQLLRHAHNLMEQCPCEAGCPRA